MPREPRYAPDGSPVELYAALGPLGEPELVHAAIPPGAAILELGAGRRSYHARAARARPPRRRGRPVRGDAEPHRGRRDRPRRHRVARPRPSLPGRPAREQLLNDPDRERVASYLGTCVRHVEPAGSVLLQKYPRDWQPDAEWRELGAVRARLRRFALDGAILRGEMEYELEDMTMIHAFEAQLIDDDGLDLELEAAGLRRRRFLDESGAWLDAFPTGAATA